MQDKPPNAVERQQDEIELALMAVKRTKRVKRTLGELTYGSDEAAEAAFARIVRAYS